MSKKIIITGASSGIGKAIAIKFAREWNDAKICLVARRIERLQELQAELTNASNEIFIHQLDVRNLSSIEDLKKILIEKWGSVDLLINNAGLALGLSPIQDGDIDDWEKMIDTNIKGLLYFTRTFAPLMVANGSGHIINIGSTAGKVVYENGNVYSATKFAVDALTQNMRIDLLRHNIKVTSINPGMVQTEFSDVRFKGDKEKAEKVYNNIQVLTPEDVADAVFYTANLPEHVCVNDLTITCTAQANSTYKFIQEN